MRLIRIEDVQARAARGGGSHSHGFTLSSLGQKESVPEMLPNLEALARLTWQFGGFGTPSKEELCL
jgi:hypothetical protein